MGNRAQRSRRHFLRGGLLAGLGLLTGCSSEPAAQPRARVPTVGVLTYLGTPGATPGLAIGALREGLHELGYGMGALDLRARPVQQLRARPAEQPDPYAGLAAELARLDPAVVLADTVAAVRAVRRAAPAVPVVMVGIGDPVGSGLVASLARPGGKVTGLSSVSPQLSGKRLQLLKESFPQVSRVAVVRNPDDAGATLDFVATQAAAGVLGLDLQAIEVRTDDDVSPALEAIGAGRAEGLLVLSDPLVFWHRDRLLGRAQTLRLPSMSDQRNYVEHGGLLAYGPGAADGWRRAAAFVDKLLKGADPGELPVEQPTTFDFVINLRAAQALGLTIPPSVLQQATELIQ